MDPVQVILCVFAMISFGVCVQEIIVYIVNRFDSITYLRGAVISFIVGIYLVISIIGNRYSNVFPENFILFRANLVFLQFSLIGLILQKHYLSDRRYNLFVLSGLIMIVLLLITSIVVPGRFLFSPIGVGNKIMAMGNELIMPVKLHILRWHLLQFFSIGVFILLSLTILISKSIDAGKGTYLAIYASVGLLIIASGIDFFRLPDIFESYLLIPMAVFLHMAFLTFLIFTRMIRDILLKYKDFEEENNLRALLNKVNVIVVKLNRLGHVEYINPYFCRLTGYQESEVIGKDWFEFFVPTQSMHELQSTFIEILEADFHPRYQNPVLMKNGEELMISWFNTQITDKKGKVNGSFSIGVEASPVEGNSG